MAKKKFRNIKVEFLFKFTMNSLILLSLWILFYKVLRGIAFIDFLYEEGIYLLTITQLFLTKVLLSIMGFAVEIYGKTIIIIGSYGVHLDRGCLGRNTLGLFIGFIFAFPGKFKSKIWFICLGIVVFIMLNILRISGLAITDYCCREKLDFNHHYVFKIITYSVIFLLWVWWVQRYSIFAKAKSKK